MGALVAAFHRHGNGGNHRARDLLFLQFCHRKSIVLNLHCFGRRVAGEEFEQRGGKGIYIALWRECLNTVFAILFRWRIAVADAHRRGGSALRSDCVILLRHAKINYEHLAVVVAQHQIAGLDVEVVDILAVDILQCAGGIFHIAQCLRLRNGTTTLHHIAKRLALDIVHHIVGGAVFLKHVENTHYVGVVQTENSARLFDKLLLETLHNLTVARSGNGHARCGIVAIAIFLEEKLLDCHLAQKQSVLRQVGDAEATLPQFFNYPIFSTLKRGIRL